MKRLSKIIKMLILFSIGLTKLSFAYIGPGAGLSALGALIAVIGGVAATIFGLLWYPIRRFLGKRKKGGEPDPEPNEDE